MTGGRRGTTVPPEQLVRFCAQVYAEHTGTDEQTLLAELLPLRDTAVREARHLEQPRQELAEAADRMKSGLGGSLRRWGIITWSTVVAISVILAVVVNFSNIYHLFYWNSWSSRWPGFPFTEKPAGCYSNPNYGRLGWRRHNDSGYRPADRKQMVVVSPQRKQ